MRLIVSVAIRLHRIAVCLIAAVVFQSMQTASRAAEFRLPTIKQAPRLDGHEETGAWNDCASFDGMLWQGQLDRRRARTLIGATEDTIYIALVSQLPDRGALLSQVTSDSPKVVEDDSAEVWIDPTPGSERGKSYQIMVNALGHAGYILHPRGGAPEDPAWNGGWKVVNREENGWWHCQIAIPIAGLVNSGRRATDGVWGINVCRNWKQPWGFSSLGGGPYAPDNIRFVFGADSLPIVHHTESTDPISGKINAELSVSNPSTGPIPVLVSMVLRRDRMPDERRFATVVLQPGGQYSAIMKLQDDATQKFDLNLNVSSVDHKTTFYDRDLEWQSGASNWTWNTAKPDRAPIDIQFAYYPYLNKMRVKATINVAEDSDHPRAIRHLSVTVRKTRTSLSIKTVDLPNVSAAGREIEFALPPLTGSYQLVIHDLGPHPIPDVVRSFERTRYEWERNSLGLSHKVYAPFTPIVVRGRQVGTVLRNHTMNNAGLWEQVVSTGQPLLSEPMRYLITSGGRSSVVIGDHLRFTTIRADSAAASTALHAQGFTAKQRSSWDYDGVMRVDLIVEPGVSRIDSVDLEIPIRNNAAPLMHAIGDGIRNTIYQQIPQGDGVVWTSKSVATQDLPAGFCSYVYLGSPIRGLCWFAENDRGWSWDRKTPNLDIVRRGDTLTLRVHLINSPVRITSARTITFGLQAAPIKPRLAPWRYRWDTDHYTLLGTDINWFALGDCGSVYPAGKDMSLWSELRKGNREHLSDAEVEQVAKDDSHYFAPYGSDYVSRFQAHVRYNLRSRYGSKMVFYYNRASYADAEEYKTFQDEWSLNDYRTPGQGNGVSEIKIVPSDSYIDHALFWYGKSFDVAGNTGVYWDNWFFVGSNNREMTSAYLTPSSGGEKPRVTPSIGLWGMRELTKRTFQYMNERRMLPFTMPHMTSTSILPLLSFATVQYDWEWKLSEGDVQGRFSREYIQLVSTGQLAGTWPVLLGDKGPLENDPWTQRTFAGVAIVHEMVASTRLNSAWDPLLKPIESLLNTPALQVYRYWDERPSPVSTHDSDFPQIIYCVSGKEAIVLITSYHDGDAEVNLQIDRAQLGFSGPIKIQDTETGLNVPVSDDGVHFPLRRHDVRELRITAAASE